jgi:hypothetical protein
MRYHVISALIERAAQQDYQASIYHITSFRDIIRIIAAELTQSRLTRSIDWLTIRATDNAAKP